MRRITDDKDRSLVYDFLPNLVFNAGRHQYLSNIHPFFYKNQQNLRTKAFFSAIRTKKGFYLREALGNKTLSRGQGGEVST